MEPKELYLQIKRIAEELVKEKETMTRSDLAYELRNYGLNIDSFELMPMLSIMIVELSKTLLLIWI